MNYRIGDLSFDKTSGNLDPHEQALLKEILSSLQMKYVELARQPGR